MTSQAAIDAYNQGVMATQRRDLQDAIHFYTIAFRLDSTMVQALENRGVARKAMGDLSGALDDYAQGIKIDPNRSSLYYNRARIKEQTGDIEGALQDYSTAIRLDPDGEEAICNRAVIYRLIGDYRSALVDLEKALQIDPRDWVAYYHRSCIRQNMGQLDSAIADLKKCLQIHPNFVQGHLDLAMTYSMFGRITDARHEFEQILSLKVQNLSVKEVQNQLWKLKAREDDPLIGTAVSTLMNFAYDHCGYRQKHAGFPGLPIEDVRWAITVKPMYLFNKQGFERDLACVTLNLCSDPEVMIRVAPIKRNFIQGNQYEISFILRAPNPNLPLPGYIEISSDKVDANATALRRQLECYLTDKRLLKVNNRLVYDSDPVKVSMAKVWVFQADEPPSQG